MHNLIVLIPGIMGSVLQDEDGRDIWAPSAAGVVSFLRTFGNSVKKLGDNPGKDGVKAARMIPYAVVIPRFYKIDGYSRLRTRLSERFDSAAARRQVLGTSSRVLEFPYDWRLSNRVTAAHLKEFVQANLHDWKVRTGATSAKCILVAHSMGGLVGRYYTEVLEGWRDCRALFTYGTPHRGSVDAIDTLSNGVDRFGIEFASFSYLARNCASIYELLPRYQAFRGDAGDQYVADVPGIPHLDQDKARTALEFHFEIERAAAANSNDEDYRKDFATIPIAGIRQETNQSATFTAGRSIAVSSRLPVDMVEFFSSGDGTVPLVSAVPIGMEKSFHVNYLKDRHACLHNNPLAQEQLLDRIGQIEQPDWSSYRGAGIGAEAAEKRARRMQQLALDRPGIRLSLKDIYPSGERVAISAALDVPEPGFDHLQAVLESVNPDGSRLEAAMQKDGEEFHLMLPAVPPGLYRISVHAPGAREAISVRDILEVMP